MLAASCMAIAVMSRGPGLSVEPSTNTSAHCMRLCWTHTGELSSFAGTHAAKPVVTARHAQSMVPQQSSHYSSHFIAGGPGLYPNQVEGLSNMHELKRRTLEHMHEASWRVHLSCLGSSASQACQRMPSWVSGRSHG